MTPQLKQSIVNWWDARNYAHELRQRIEDAEHLLRITEDDISGFQAQIRSFAAEGPSRLIEVEPGVFVVLAWQYRDDFHIMEHAVVEKVQEAEVTYVRAK
jgi:hypothetical protein